jgi:hypothetical protein
MLARCDTDKPQSDGIAPIGRVRHLPFSEAGIRDPALVERAKAWVWIYRFCLIIRTIDQSLRRAWRSASLRLPAR